MHAVVQSEHKGASVEKLRVTPEITYDASARSYAPIMVECEDYRDRQAYQAIKIVVDGLKDGAFPSLQCLDLGIAEPSLAFFGREIGQLLIDALKGGAPCAKTLRIVDLHGMSQKHVQEVEALLSEGALVS